MEQPGKICCLAIEGCITDDIDLASKGQEQSAFFPMPSAKPLACRGIAAGVVVAIASGIVLVVIVFVGFPHHVSEGLEIRKPIGPSVKSTVPIDRAVHDVAGKFV